MGHFQYLIVLATCLAVTLPLELACGARVYREPRRAGQAVLWGAIPFVAGDAVAAHAHVWAFNPLFVTGWRPALGLPIEELLFFVVVPLCTLLTFEAVEALLARSRKGG